MTVEAWTDAATVLSVTGVDVTDGSITQAQADIEIFTGRTYADTERIRSRDLYWLGRAVAYQAAWRPGQPGIESRMDTTAQSQDGVSANFGPDAVVLAPMAARAINRLSWRRSRTVHIRSPYVDGNTWLGPDPLAEGNDESQPWFPMGGAP
ncbi:hypothetical protein [Kitasatospora camelliae]|uniref:Uncharacterized protein n=1 Tax=Kitasatospora camelliae TaxID=3156397 RepID=A0AAU8K626_9ACTN